MLLANLILISIEFSYMCYCKANSSETEPYADIKLCSYSKEFCRVKFSFLFGNPGKPNDNEKVSVPKVICRTVYP